MCIKEPSLRAGPRLSSPEKSSALPFCIDEGIRLPTTTMRGLGSRRPLLPMRTTTVLLGAVFLLSSFGVASTRSVENSRDDVLHSDEAISETNGQSFVHEKKIDDVFSPQIVQYEGANEPGKSAIESQEPVSKVSEVDQEGIRRFDAVVATDEIPETGSRDNVESSGIDKTVIKGITVRDEPLDSEDDKVRGDEERVEGHRKRSLKDPRSIAADSQMQQNEEAAMKDEVGDHSEKVQEKILIDGEDHVGDPAVPSEIKKIVVGEDGVGSVEAKVEEVLNARNIEQIEGKVSDDGTRAEDSQQTDQDSESSLVSRDSLSSPSLPDILKTNASLESLKAQAVALQTAIKDEAFLKQLRKETEILPGIPKFTEKELFDTLNMISLGKQGEEQSDYSYLSKMDTSSLTENQLSIIRCAEALVVREQRQSFSENLFECIRSLSILNCMRIFIWPVIADNIPESFSQNLPTFPIEVNVADWLPGREREKSVDTELRSSSFEDEKLVTPEFVVSKILKEALSANPNTVKDLPTLIDPKNETLSKFLTPGQLEILRMAEMFLPVSSRQEYSDKMYSCVQRFEYFSCVKYFAWPMVKQHYSGLPEFPDYQNWYPNVSLYPGYPILPYPSAEGGLPEVIEADATRTKSSKPELVIVDLLKDTRRQTGIPIVPSTYYSTIHAGTRFSPITPDQMSIFYTAEQLIPVPMRSEFMSRTMKCIRNYDYLTCTKYSTWPTIRQLYPTLPSFPDFSTWIPTFSVPEIPDFSEYITNWQNYFPTLPGFPHKPPAGGGSGQQPGGGSSGEQTGGGSSGQGSGGGSSGQASGGGSSGQQTGGGSSGPQTGGTSSGQQTGSGSWEQQQSSGSSGQQSGSGSWSQGSGGGSSGQQSGGGSWGQGSGGGSSGQQSGGGSWGQGSSGGSSGQQSGGGSWGQGSGGGSSGQQTGSGSSGQQSGGGSSGQQQPGSGSWGQGSGGGSSGQQSGSGSWVQGSGGSSSGQQSGGGSSGQQSGGGSSGQQSGSGSWIQGSGGSSSGQQSGSGSSGQQSGGGSSGQQGSGSWEQQQGSGSSGQQSGGGSWVQGSGGSGSSGQQSGGGSSGQQQGSGSWEQQQGSGSSGQQSGGGSWVQGSGGSGSSGQQSGGGSSGQQQGSGSWEQQQGSGSSGQQSGGGSWVQGSGGSGSSGQQSGGGSSGQQQGSGSSGQQSGSGSWEQQQGSGSSGQQSGSGSWIQGGSSSGQQPGGGSVGQGSSGGSGQVSGGGSSGSQSGSGSWEQQQGGSSSGQQSGSGSWEQQQGGSSSGQQSGSGSSGQQSGGGSSEQPVQPQPLPIPSKPSYLPHPHPIPIKPPYLPPGSGSTVLSEADHRLYESTIEKQIIDILSNIRFTLIPKNSQQNVPVTQGSLAIMNSLTPNQLKIFGLSKSVIPVEARTDLDARFIGCLQGGSDFLSCTRNVIWPTLQFYVRDMPNFPKEEKTKISLNHLMESPGFSGLANGYVITPGIFQPIIHPTAEISGRSPLGSEILAEPEEESPMSSQAQSHIEIPSEAPAYREPAGQLRQEVSAKSGEPLTPVISVTDTRFTPIFSDHPETVLLKILLSVRSSTKLSDSSQMPSSESYLESFSSYLTPNELSVVQASEHLLPANMRAKYMEKMSRCVQNSNFMMCSRDVLWPTLSLYYPRLPSFPNFNIEADSVKKINSPAPPFHAGSLSSAISETDIKTGQHGDAMVTITDTRFVPIFSEHPEELILGILKSLQTSLPSSSSGSETKEAVKKSTPSVATFTDQQGNIVTLAETFLPESIREVFRKRMTDCMRDNLFLDCTRDIAWPTIAQFFPRLPNFPNIGVLPAPAVDNEKPAGQSTLLPPQLDPIQTLGHTIVAQSNVVPPSVNMVPSSPDDEVESRIETTLKRISSVTKNLEQPEQTYTSKDPLVSPLVSERQANVIRMCENLLPNSIKPVFVGKMVECSRADAFPNCIRNIGWPTLRQYVPNIPEFPDFSSLGSYIPQEIPQAPQFPDYQPSVQIPSLGSFGLPGQNYFYPFRISAEAVAHQQSPYIPQSVINSGGQPGGFYSSGSQGLTSSVADSVLPGARAVASAGLPLVPTGDPTGESTDLPSESETHQLNENTSTERRRRRRSLEPEDQQINDSQTFNLTEPELLRILINMTNERDKKESNKSYLVESLNETMKQSLTPEQYEILTLLENVDSETIKAGFMSKVIQCIRSLSFLRCMGIFVWPMISQNLPSLPSLPSLPTLGSLNPFGRSESENIFEELFGRNSDDFEKVLLERKGNVEKILVEWYRGLTEQKFERDYGFVRLKGYGDGEIGVSFDGFGRKGKAVKFKDNKNLPSILTIISDIMEDMLEQRDSKPDHPRKRERAKKEKFRHDKSLRDRSFADEYNGLGAHNSRQEPSSDDHKIISMIIEKMRSNGSEEIGDLANNYLTVDDAYEAFEMLFGTRLNERPNGRLGVFGRASDSRHRKDDKEKRDRSGLILRLPGIDEELLSRRATGSLRELARKMEMEMSPVVPTIGFVVSLFIQTFLAHARAAASIAGMMSNMALGSAMLSMLRQTFFGPTMDPKIKYVYDHAPTGPGISWPQHIHH